tara:strand:- start:228 stop:446 length:219 start_codon:yes stop_codon:yes gene_type:complete
MEDQEVVQELVQVHLTYLQVLVIIHPLPLYKVLMEEQEINIVVHQVLDQNLAVEVVELEQSVHPHLYLQMVL